MGKGVELFDVQTRWNDLERWNSSVVILVVLLLDFLGGTGHHQIGFGQDSFLHRDTMVNFVLFNDILFAQTFIDKPVEFRAPQRMTGIEILARCMAIYPASG